ncbi:MAG TPA: Rieske (2Fe-2S) protein [Bacillus sp. (in: firmicutes)]|nr:Rieske (2Fe-2S) protein [Bacillus sp. (in: firmicutes)]
METMKERKLTSVIVCSAEELKPGERKLVEIDGVEIAIVNAEGQLYAFRNRCPHQGVEMVYGAISGAMLPSNPGEFIYGCDNQIVRCPLHGWEFDMKTGKSLFSPDKVSIGSYDIQEVEGSIVLTLKREPKSISLKNFRCTH